MELAQKLGFNDSNGLARIDYQYIEKEKSRSIWQELVISTNRKKERERYRYISNLSFEELKKAMNFEGIQTLSHLALHFMISPKHGRKVVKNRIILELKFQVKPELHKGIFGVSNAPQHWPTPYYERRVGVKPMVCLVCGFKATHRNQIELNCTIR